MRSGRIWQLWTVALAAALLLGLSLPHHHEHDEDHGDEVQQGCPVCTLQEAAGSGWCPAPVPTVVDWTVAFLVQPAPESVVLPVRLGPHAPRAPPVA